MYNNNASVYFIFECADNWYKTKLDIFFYSLFFLNNDSKLTIIKYCNHLFNFNSRLKN